MKLTATFSFLALLPSIGAQCDICPSGVTGGNDTIIPESNGTTCEQVALYAALNPNITVDECAEVKTGTHYLCCPEDVGPGCDFCATGIEDEELVFEDGTACAELAFLKSIASQELCPSFLEADPACCPLKTGNLCDFCPTGVTAPDAVLDLGDEADTITCAEADAYASLLSDETFTCTTFKFTRNVCCPADAGEGCTFCADGVTDPDAVVDADTGTTCLDLGDLAKLAPDEQCYNFVLAEFLCCPATAAPAPTNAPAGPTADAPTASEDSESSVGYSSLFGLITTVLIGTFGFDLM